MRIRVARLGALAARHEHHAELRVWNAHAGSHDEAALVGEQLEHGRGLDAENLGRRTHGLVHQLRRACALERMLAEVGDGGLLRRPPLELGLHALSIGDVGEHPVPSELPLPVADQRGIVSDPHHDAVAVHHAVLGRGGLELLP
jgi:hypothetical protein